MYAPMFDDEYKKSIEYKDTLSNETKAFGQEIKLQSLDWGFGNQRD